jgi:iron complex transport system substrate-binding protein
MRAALLLIWLIGSVQAEPVRVVSLAPSLTEIICAIGATNSLVGRSSACKYPPAVTNVAVAGDFGIPALEAIALGRPDLVVTVDLAEKNSIRALERLGIRHVSIPCRSLDDIPTAIRALGNLLRREETAGQLAGEFEQRLATLRTQAPTQRRRVFIEVWSDPLVTAGRRSFLNDLLTLAGGDNIAADVERDFYQISPEAVLARAPEVVIVLNPSRREWKAQRVCRDLDRDLLSIPGPRVLEAVEALKNCIQESRNPKSETRNKSE